jgi:hypothetical protein
MVRLPINVLWTGCQPFGPFPVTVFFLLASISSIRRMYRLSRRRTVYVCLLGVKCLVPLSDGLEGRTFPTTPLRPKTTGGFNRARECIGPTRPYYNARNRGSSIQATNCACDAECWLAPVTLSFLLTTSLFDCNLGDVLGAHVTRYSLPLRMLPSPSPRSMDHNRLGLRCAPPSYSRTHTQRRSWWRWCRTTATGS